MTKELVIEHLKFILKDNLYAYIVSFEKSDNDHHYEHYHAYLELKKKCDIRCPRFLDILDVHGEYQAVRSKGKAILYTIKDKDFIAQNIDIHKHILKTIHNPFRKFIYMCREELIPDRKSAQLYLDSHSSKDDSILWDYYSSPNKYKRFVRDHFPTPPPRLFIELHVEVWHQIEKWYRDKKTSLFIHGAQGIGKTSLVLVMFQDRVLLVRHKDALKSLNSNHQAILFDDMCFNHLTPEQNINILDSTADSHLDVKGSMAHITPEVRKIFSSNKTKEECFTKPLKSLVGISQTEDSTRVTKNFRVTKSNSLQLAAIMRRITAIEIEPKHIRVHAQPVEPREGFTLISEKTIDYLDKMFSKKLASEEKEDK